MRYLPFCGRVVALCCLWFLATNVLLASSSFVVAIRPSLGALRAGIPAQLEIAVRNTTTDEVIKNLAMTHEELFHIYVVSEDLRYYAHEHAHWDARGFLRLDTTFPRAGMYRLLSEYQPSGAAAQFSEGTLLVGSADSPAASSDSPGASTTAPASAPVLVSFRTEPSPPQPGIKTPLIFSISPAEGLEKFHGDWGQLLVASEDLIDLIRAEPAFVNGGQMQFNIYFPRAQRYRMWLEYRHSGVLRRERLDLEVKELR